MVEIISVLTNIYVQAILWVVCVAFAIYFVFAVKKMSFGDDTGSSAWIIIAVGLTLIGLRVSFKAIFPNLDGSYFLQTLRYLIGMVGIIIIFIGFIKYQSTLRKLFGVTD